MANPACIVEQFVYQFMCQWNCGLEPSLSLDTKPNGAISIDFKVVTSPIKPFLEEEFVFRDRSGRGSRRRRQKQRAAVPTGTIPEAEADETPVLDEHKDDVDDEAPAIDTEVVTVAAVENAPTLAITNSNDYTTKTDIKYQSSPCDNLCHIAESCSNFNSQVMRSSDAPNSDEDEPPQEFLPFICDNCHEPFEPDDFVVHMDTACYRSRHPRPF